MSDSTSDPDHTSPRIAALAAAAPVLAAALVGNFVTTPNIPWYDTLAKPPLTPPGVDHSLYSDGLRLLSYCEA